jgi:hypothetical protein
MKGQVAGSTFQMDGCMSNMFVIIDCFFFFLKNIIASMGLFFSVQCLFTPFIKKIAYYDGTDGSN